MVETGIDRLLFKRGDFSNVLSGRALRWINWLPGEIYTIHWHSEKVRGAIVVRLASLLPLPALGVDELVAGDGGIIGLIGTLVAVAGIVGFAIAAAGWTIDHDV